MAGAGHISLAREANGFTLCVCVCVCVCVDQWVMRVLPATTEAKRTTNVDIMRRALSKSLNPSPGGVNTTSRPLPFTNRCTSECRWCRWW